MKLRRSSRYLKFVFGSYTYLEKICLNLINSLPKSVRKYYWKFLFKDMGKNVFIDESCYFRYPWKISIGNNVTINRGCEIYPSMMINGTAIRIHDGAILAPNVVLFGAGQDPRNPSEADVSESITIGNNAYIGGNSVIRYGVEIGANSTVGAGSVVVSSVHAGTLVGGNPAKFIRNL
jgi:acetyltransferase-like isoleucine patch superfamily enzyme